MADKEYVSLEDEQSPDTLECVCGNAAHNDGFVTCDEQGNEVSFDEDGPWNGELLSCNRCRRIINQHTLEVVGINPDATRLPIE